MGMMICRWGVTHISFDMILIGAFIAYVLYDYTKTKNKLKERRFGKSHRIFPGLDTHRISRVIRPSESCRGAEGCMDTPRPSGLIAVGTAAFTRATLHTPSLLMWCWGCVIGFAKTASMRQSIVYIMHGTAKTNWDYAELNSLYIYIYLFL